MLNTRISGKNKIASRIQFELYGVDFIYWTKSNIRRGTISGLQGDWYKMTCDNMSKQIRKETVNKLVKQKQLMIGVKKLHPWRKAPVFKLRFMEREFFGSIPERQRDTTSVMITGFHNRSSLKITSFLKESRW